MNAAATHANGPKSFGTRTSSITILNIQILSVSIAGTSTTSSRLRAIHLRYGRAYGQNRRAISRSATLGAMSTASVSLVVFGFFIIGYDNGPANSPRR